MGKTVPNELRIAMHQCYQEKGRKQYRHHKLTIQKSMHSVTQGIVPNVLKERMCPSPLTSKLVLSKHV